MRKRTAADRVVELAARYASKSHHVDRCRSRYGTRCSCGLDDLRAALLAYPLPAADRGSLAEKLDEELAEHAERLRALLARRRAIK